MSDAPPPPPGDYPSTPPPPPPGGYRQPSAPPPPPPYGQPYGAAGPLDPRSRPLASWGQRALAYVIDSGVGLGIWIGAVILGGVLGAVSDVLGTLVVFAGWLANLAWFGYILVQQGKTGQTFGKQRMGIRLIGEETGQPVGVGMSIGRYFVHIVDALPCYLGFLFPLWDVKRQTFADKILRTIVVVG